jgi:hypothetical protein
MLLQTSVLYTYQILGMVFGTQVMQYLLENSRVLEIGRLRFVNVDGVGGTVNETGK